MSFPSLKDQQPPLLCMYVCIYILYIDCPYIELPWYKISTLNLP